MTLPLLYVIACKSALSLRRPGRCPHALLAVLETGAAPPPGRCPGPFWGPMPPVIRSRLRAPHSPLPRPARCSHTRARAHPEGGGQQAATRHAQPGALTRVRARTPKGGGNKPQRATPSQVLSHACARAPRRGGQQAGECSCALGWIRKPGDSKWQRALGLHGRLALNS